MLVLKRAQRAVFVEKLPDAANLALAALVFAQFLEQGMFSAGAALVGLGLWVFFLAAAVMLAGGGEL
jgi:hypothetical protein